MPRPKVKLKSDPPRKPAAKTRTGKRNDYTDAEKVAALLALESAGWAFKPTAKALGIPRSTLQRWANGDRSYHILAIRDRYRGDMLKQLRNAAWALGESVQDPLAIKRATLSQRAAAFVAVHNRLIQMEKGDQPPPGPQVNVNVNLNLDFAALTDDELEEYERLQLAMERLQLKIDRSGPPLVGQPGEGATPLQTLPPHDVPRDESGPG